MQALVWTGPRQIEMQDVDAPKVAAGEVLLRVGLTGICGSDLSGYLGSNSLRIPPLIMGHEVTGEIVEVGPEPAPLAEGSVARPGQGVVVNPLIACGRCDLCQRRRPNLCRQRQILGIHRPGGLAELVAVPATQCYPLPAGLSEREASVAEPLACGFRAVSQAHIDHADSLLILGAGSIGLLCLVAARSAGLDRIMITDVSSERLRVAEELGAWATIRAEEAEVDTEVKRLTDSQGAGAAIDAVGLQSTRRQAVMLVRPGSRAVFMGLHHEQSEIEANYIVRQEVEVAGAFAYLPEEFARAVEVLGQGVLAGHIGWIVERSMHEGATIFADLAAGHSPAVKIALRPMSDTRS